MMKQAWAIAAVSSMLASCVGTGGLEPAGNGFVMKIPDPADPSIKIIGGAPADPRQWPATFIFDNRCTATAVGERVILTAGHCVRDNATGTVLTPVPVPVTCTRHPSYNPGPYTYDVALCLTQAPIRNVRFENVNTRPVRIAVKTSVTILGYGCLQEGGGMANALYIGSATIIADPANPNPPSLYTLEGGAVSCAGDSGGGGYVSEASRRFLVGVMSSSHIPSRRSRQVSMTDPDVRRFLDVWSGPPATSPSVASIRTLRAAVER